MSDLFVAADMSDSSWCCCMYCDFSYCCCCYCCCCCKNNYYKSIADEFFNYFSVSTYLLVLCLFLRISEREVVVFSIIECLVPLQSGEDGRRTPVPLVIQNLLQPLRDFPTQDCPMWMRCRKEDIVPCSASSFRLGSNNYYYRPCPNSLD